MCTALVLALAPAAPAEAAKGSGKGKSCAVAKKAAKGKQAKKAKKSCAKKAKKAKKAKAKAEQLAPQTAAAQRECRTDRRLDPEGFATDYGTGPDAVAKCAAELLTLATADETEDEPLADEPLETEPTEEEAPLADDEPLEPESEDLA